MSPLPTPGRSSSRVRQAARWVTSLLVVVGVLVAGDIVFFALASLKEDPPQKPPQAKIYRVPVFLVEELNVRPLITTFGSVRSDEEAVIAAEVGGRVLEVFHLEVGTSVPAPDSLPAGSKPSQQQPVLKIDPANYQQRYDQVIALIEQDDVEWERLEKEMANNRKLLEQKKKSREAARMQLKRQQDLNTKGAGRKADLTRAELEFQQYDAAVLQLELDLSLEDVRRKQILAKKAVHERDLELAKLDLERTEVYAPFDGTISEVFVEKGQYVRPGEPLFRLTNVNRVEVTLPIPISQSGEIARQLAMGVQPRVHLADHETAQARWDGKVSRMAPVADEATRTVNLFVVVDNTGRDDPLRPGAFVHARIQSETFKNVKLIPRDVVDNDSLLIVQKNKQGQLIAQRRNVTLGKTVNEFVVVLSGLDPGDVVIANNLDVLEPGMLIDISDERNLSSELSRQEIPAFEIVSGAIPAERPAEIAVENPQSN